MNQNLKLLRGFSLVESTNEEWLSDLKESSPRFDAAIAELRLVLQKGLSAGLKKWQGLNKETLEDIIQDVLVKIVPKIDTFQRNCRFTTWALKIGVNTAITELRHRRWRDVSLDEIIESGGMNFLSGNMSKPSFSPEKQTIQHLLMDTLKRLITTELTERQRKALMAVRIQGIPLEEVARQMGTNRNSLYKLLHDARLRLKKAILKEELTPRDLIDAFISS